MTHFLKMTLNWDHTFRKIHKTAIWHHPWRRPKWSEIRKPIFCSYWNIPKQKISILGIFILLEVLICLGEILKLNLPVKDMWHSHHLFIWPWPLIVTFSFVDYVNILKIDQGNVIHGIDAYAAWFSRTIHNTLSVSFILMNTIWPSMTFKALWPLFWRTCIIIWGLVMFSRMICAI